MDNQENIPEKNSKKADYTKKLRENPWIAATFVLGVLSLILILGYFYGGITGNSISKNEAGEKLLQFYKDNGAPDELKVDSVSEESGLYVVNFDYSGEIIPIYMTKDGDLAGPLTMLPSESSGSVSTTEEIPTSEKPVVDLYVMSFCPYGNLAEDTMLPVYELLKDKVEWNIQYIVSVSGETVNSLHGQPEVDQNIREVCVKKYYDLDTFWDFVTYVNENCGSDGSCWEEAATSLGLSTATIETCFNNEGLSLMEQEASIVSAAGVSGSPTMFINGVKTTAVYNYGDSDAYKEVICSAFENAPEECSTALDSTDAGVSGSC